MWNFQYKHGDKPLEGYTIQRGAGRGGFGEVYYAISDSGREVALKAVLGYEQIELRGISQCMNLKNPHLVTIFDVKYNDQGRPFVIMEFVAGPSLRQILDDAPAGLGTQKAAFFLREIGKGLTFLHDSGIVHRDLKPANIFFENGYVKIGDYGLSKAISATAHTTQTVTVGTVHYMAPEVGVGKYDRSIDIYAMGAVLYEMLTGMVPFHGASPSEILMKHLASEPDCSNIPEPFCTVIRKAMAKDPAQRYQSIQEMVEGVFGEEHIRQSVSVFSPDQLSMVAAHAAQRVGAGAGVGAGVGAGAVGTSSNTAAPSDALGKAGAWADRVSDRLAGIGQQMTDLGARAIAPGKAPSSHTFAVPGPVNDPMTRGQRKLMAALTAVVVAVLAGLVTSRSRIEPVVVIPFVALAVYGAALGIHLALTRITPQISTESHFAKQLATGGMATLLAVLFSVGLWASAPEHLARNITGTWLAILAPLFFMDTASWAASNRPERVSFWDTAFLAGLFGWIVSLFVSGDGWLAAMTLVGISLTTQVLAPWDPNAPRPAPPGHKGQKLRTYINMKFSAAGQQGPQPARSGPPPLPRFPMTAEPAIRYVFSVIPWGVRIAWLFFAIVSFGLGISCLVAAGTSHYRSEIEGFLNGGLCLVLFCAMCSAQACRARFYSWWGYLIKPVVLLGCGVSVVISAVIIGNENMVGEEIAVCVFFIVVPVLLGVVMLFIPGARRTIAENPGAATPQAPAWETQGPMERLHGWRQWRREQRQWRRSQRQWRRAQRPPINLLAGPTALVLLAAAILTLAVTINIPEAISMGLPDTRFRDQLTREVFTDYPAWPELLLKLGGTAAAILTLITAALMIIGRRGGGITHILRGLIGMSALISAAAVLGSAFRIARWSSVAVLVNSNKPVAAVADFTNGFRSELAITAAGLFLAAIVLLGWPQRRITPATTPAPEQKGAVA